MSEEEILNMLADEGAESPESDEPEVTSSGGIKLSAFFGRF